MEIITNANIYKLLQVLLSKYIYFFNQINRDHFFTYFTTAPVANLSASSFP